MLKFWGRIKENIKTRRTSCAQPAPHHRLFKELKVVPIAKNRTLERIKNLMNMADFASSESSKSSFTHDATLTSKECEYRKKVRLLKDIPAVLRAKILRL
jgi:hypothetical protein